MTPFGAILAGGESSRYGSPKALAKVGGVRIIDRVVAALGAVTPEVVLLANEPGLFRDLRLPTRPDVHRGLGALGGIHAALVWAREAGRPGILAVACDIPFPSTALLRRLGVLAFGDADGAESAGRASVAPDAGHPDVVVPESPGRRGIEPLFAAYGVCCLPAIEARIEAGDHRVISFHDDVRVVRIPLAEVETVGDPAKMFLNVNTSEERERAERMLEELR